MARRKSRSIGCLDGLWIVRVRGLLSDEYGGDHQIGYRIFQCRDLGRRHRAARDHFEARRQYRGVAGSSSVQGYPAESGMCQVHCPRHDRLGRDRMPVPAVNPAQHVVDGERAGRRRHRARVGVMCCPDRHHRRPGMTVPAIEIRESGRKSGIPLRQGCPCPASVSQAAASARARSVSTEIHACTAPPTAAIRSRQRSTSARAVSAPSRTCLASARTLPGSPTDCVMRRARRVVRRGALPSRRHRWSASRRRSRR